MSTRGWYEYYVVDDATKQVSLAIQFYKWGNAEPENALEELTALRALTKTLGGRIPVHLVRDMLVDNVGPAFESLPSSFPLGCYYFLLQRAAEELSPFRGWRFAAKGEERADYQLGYAVGQASAERGIVVPRHDHPVVNRAHFSLAVGTLIRRWPECSTRMTFLRWLHHITQVTAELDMGSLAGDYRMPLDCSYVYRLFFRVPRTESEDQPIHSIRMQLCARGGVPLLDALRADIERGGEDAVYATEAYECLSKDLQAAHYEPASLEQILQTHSLVPSPFWERRLPRNEYLGP